MKFAMKGHCVGEQKVEERSGSRRPMRLGFNEGISRWRERKRKPSLPEALFPPQAREVENVVTRQPKGGSEGCMPGISPPPV
jgi:hypothetical protein